LSFIQLFSLSQIPAFLLSFFIFSTFLSAVSDFVFGFPFST